MGDPLTVAASVVALVTISAQIYTAVDSFVDKVKDAPSRAHSLRSDVNSFHGCISSFQVLLTTAAFQPTCGELLSARNVVTTLTDAVPLLDEIKEELSPLTVTQSGRMSIVDRGRWVSRSGRLLLLQKRLHNSISILTLQVSILQW
ncbi:hypothetical protein LTR85_009385 [Meristemomyces frigidus]|nr:hypothetical protein LTR85_009385 [Meristemomyces frigidus]